MVTFQHDRVKVKVTVTIFEKLCHHVSAFVYEPILILFYNTQMFKYDNILDEFEFERSRAKVKVAVAIFRKRLSPL